MAQDFMTVKGVKRQKERKESLYWDWPHDDYGIFYYPHKKSGLLLRQTLMQDLPLVMKHRRNWLKHYPTVITKNGKWELTTQDQILPPDKEEDVKELIRLAHPENNAHGNMTLTVFNMKTKDFVAFVDIEVKKDESAIISIVFSNNKKAQEWYEPKLREILKNIIIKEMRFKKVYQEVMDVKSAQGYKIVPV